MAGIGKRIIDDLYLHVSALGELDAEVFDVQRVSAALQTIQAAAKPTPNVIKLNLRTGRFSLLSYPDFEEGPFPELAASWTFASASDAPPAYRIYTDSLNPPILHRKELLVARDYPLRAEWEALTKAAAEIGLFDDTTTIGFKLNWERLITAKGYRLVGGAFSPIGNEVNVSQGPLDTGGPIQRHLTALTRSNLSAPIQLLIKHGLISTQTSVFDYGCGRGGDVAGLCANGFVAQGWDPHYVPDRPLVPADVVNLGFVVNVIEDPAERVEVLNKAFGLARQVMSVGVMLHGSDSPGHRFRDGYITSINTFQKYFSQGELKDFLEHVLNQEAFLVGPGVALVFADKSLEQRFSSERFRSRGVATRLLARRSPRPRAVTPPKIRVTRPPPEPRAPRPHKPTHAELEMARKRPILDALWALSLDLGRWPEADEVAFLDSVQAQFGSVVRGLRLVQRLHNTDLLSTAAQTRCEDVCLYLATRQFLKRPHYRELERRLQRDIRAFFGDYRSAQAAAIQLLHDAADSTVILDACKKAASLGLGRLEEDHDLQLHVSLVERLPVVLRAYVACGLLLWGDMSEIHLVKIHTTSGKLTLLEFESFDDSPIPLLRRRIKVNVRKQDYDLFEYGSPAFPKTALYRKSRYLHEDYPGYAEQLAFDEALDHTGILDNSEFGPAVDELYRQLELRRLGTDGLRMVRSALIPQLDQACGSNFTFRAFIDCGDTQQRLMLKNIPLRPQTYNALFDLATRVLDPVVDYFGGIRLTYGFCSAELSKHVPRRVAPRLDQHACFETLKNGHLICERGGAACDFLVEDENMREVADWIIANTPFDRLYYYGADRPLHVSYSDTPARRAFNMVETSAGRLMPRPY